MTRLPLLRGFLRTLIGLPERTPWDYARTTPIYLIKRAIADIKRAAGPCAAGPCDAPLWRGDMSGIWPSR